MKLLLSKRSLALQPYQAAGIVGNMFGESGWNPSSYIASDSGQGQSGGLCHWHDEVNGKGRFTDLYNFTKERGKEWSDLKSQIDYLEKELLKTETEAFKALKAASDVTEATIAFYKKFERPKNPVVPKTRKIKAKEVLANYNSSQNS